MRPADYLLCALLGGALTGGYAMLALYWLLKALGK